MIADSFDLALSSPINSGPTRFSDTVGESDSVINLMFLRCRSSKLDRHSIHPDSRLFSDHAPLTVDIPICDEIIQSTKLIITPGSDQEKEFFKDIFASFTLLDTSNINSVENFNSIVNQLGSIINQAWTKHAKRSKLSKHSKQWWTNSCSIALNNYRMSRSRDSWKAFKSSTREAKRLFFDSKIKEIANKSRGLWELMNWVKKKKLPATKAIKYNGSPCLFPNSLWNAFHNSFNTALNRQVNVDILNEIEFKPCQI